MESKDTQQKAPSIDDLIEDLRLARLFSNDDRSCALQLWVLQVKNECAVENRILYGRLVPYSHSSNRWSAGDDDDFRLIGKNRAQIVRVNLYIGSAHCAQLMRLLSQGCTLSTITEKLGLAITSKLSARIGRASVAYDMTFRPACYQLNRDAHDGSAPASPHGTAGAISASLTQTDKRALFRVDCEYDAALCDFVISQLNADTGLDFGAVDLARLGDIELLVFPALDDQERSLLTTTWAEEFHCFVARFNPTQVPNFQSFQFRLCILNDGQVTYTAIVQAQRVALGVFEARFEVGAQVRGMTDCTELEIFGFNDDRPGLGALCCRWRIGYIREVSLQGHLVGAGSSPVKFDWLEKTTRSTDAGRVQAALTIDRRSQGSTAIGNRKVDSWVPANRSLRSLFSQLHPAKSEGRFFSRWGQGDGSGRLEFVEWFKAVLAKYKQHQIVIFDPYFEAAGLGLLALYAVADADYIVFTSFPKSWEDGSESTEVRDGAGFGRVSNLLAACEHNRPRLVRCNLRVIGLKEGRLHDRYILVMGQDQLPVAGFNLSNSFQTAAENFPLLVTPIPKDVLLQIEAYKTGLLREVSEVQDGQRGRSASLRIIFDSKTTQVTSKSYEPLGFLERSHAGNLFSRWFGEPSLSDLSGEPLRCELARLGALVDGSLKIPGTASIRNIWNKSTDDFTALSPSWEILGEALACTPADERNFHELGAEVGFLEFLTEFLKASFQRKYSGEEAEVVTADARFFKNPIEALLHSSYYPHHLAHHAKYAALTWSEYYAISFLWRFAPDVLVSAVEIQSGLLSDEFQGSDVVRLSLLSQIVSAISMSVQFEISHLQKGILLKSTSGLLRWLGLNAIEAQLENPADLQLVLDQLSGLPSHQRTQAIGWMINRAARNPQRAEVLKGLTFALRSILPTRIQSDDLERLVNSMRGHMKQIAWTEPWLFNDMILPLLQSARLSCDDASVIWMREIAEMLEPQSKSQSLHFDHEREGQTTNVAAFLFAYSGPDQRNAILKNIRTILKRQQRVIQQPLASTSNWSRWDRALMVSLWVLIYCRWGQHYLLEQGIVDSGLDQVSNEAQRLVRSKSIDEWRDDRGVSYQLMSVLEYLENN